ncbi:helix-turn-helix transcriptional regulator [Rhodococcus sp. OK302]|uniref:helix-turn-helix transcriptional regulator n=1 Tax=Rhodococcus sp. OK302 TaxID=1882769 RepID=UPI000B93B399|nr:LuxR family transcriptional regulator [Rhodococcus sp. OK302]OYD69677.1 AAA ATPase-like protein [Rhodococcus sp. OK302]
MFSLEALTHATWLDVTIRRITAHLEAAQSGRGTALVLVGPPRSGRTRLLARLSGPKPFRTVMLTGSGNANESIDVSVAALLARLESPAYGKSDGVPETRPLLRADADVSARGECLLDVIEKCTRESDPLLIVVDDADELPDTSRDVLGYVGRRLANHRVLLILVSGLERPVQFLPFPQIAVPQLSVEDTAALTTAVLGRTVAPTLVRELHRAAAGNLGDTVELCGALTDDQIAGLASIRYPMIVSAQRTDRWERVCSRLTENQRILLTILALVQSISVEIAVHVAQSSEGADAVPISVEAEVSSLIELRYIEQLGDRLHIGSDMDRWAIRTLTSPAFDARARTVIASYGHAGGSAADTYLPGVGDAVNTVEMVATRATNIARDQSCAQALSMLREAAATFTDDERAMLLALASQLAISHGFLTDADEFADTVVRDYPVSRYRALMEQIKLEVRHLADRPMNLERVTAAAVSLVDHDPDGARSLAALAILAQSEHHRTDGIEFLLKLARANAEPQVTAVSAWCKLAEVTLAVDAENPALAQALYDESDSQWSFSQRGLSEAIISASLLSRLGRLGEARDRIECASDLPDSAQPPLARANLLISRVNLELLSGNIVVAHNLWDRAESILPACSYLPSARTAQQVQILGLRGRFEEADRVAAQALPVGGVSSASRISARLLAALGQNALMRGHADRAVMLLEQSIDHVDRHSGIWQTRRYIDLIEALMMADDRQSAERVLDLTTRRLRSCATPLTSALLARGRLLVADIDSCLELLELALGPRELEVPALERARALAIYADRLRTHGRIAQSRQRQRTAHALFERVGAQGWIDGGRWSSGAPTVIETHTDPRVLTLTGIECKIANLVVTGLRNRDIAAQLYISQRLVEKHLTSMFRKLGISSRAGLYAAIKSDSRSPHVAAPLVSPMPLHSPALPEPIV